MHSRAILYAFYVVVFAWCHDSVLGRALQEAPVHRGSSHAHALGDATPAERALLPNVTAASRAATAARFEALTLDALKNSDDEGRASVSDVFGRRNDDGQKGRAQTPLEAVTSSYLSNEGVYLHLRGYESRCGAISRVVPIGTSVEGVPIEALEISNTLGEGMKDGKPHVKLVATIHGDETSGGPTTLGVAEWLCANYERDAEARRIVEGLHLWVVPVMNPDGYKAKTRYNARGIDLNRDFPDQYRGGMCMCPSGRQPETQALMELTDKYPFVSSLAFHEGALVVNYPLDGTPDGKSHYMASADDETFIYLAHAYADNHPVLSKMRQRGFANGITNGASWYTIYGGMQDWNYLQENAMELTLEISERKSPAASELPTIYEQNMQSILEFIRLTALDSLEGRVVSSTGAGIQGASVSIKGIDSSVTTRDGGYFTRPLAPGKYTMVVEKNGYKVTSQDVTIRGGSAPPRVEVVLQKTGNTTGGKKKKKTGSTKKKKTNPSKKQQVTKEKSQKNGRKPAVA